MNEHVSYAENDGIATIVMDDGKANALSLALQGQIHAALDRAEADGAVVVLVGRDGVFSGGFDLATLAEGGRAATDMVQGGFELALRVRSFPAPVVVACTGHAVAMGAFLMLACDYRIGGRGDYKLVANEVAIGLTLPHTAAEILRQRLTPAAFDRAACLSDMFTAANAVETGWLDRVVAPEEVVATAHDHARRLQGLDRAAHTATKLRVREAAITAIRTAIERDRQGVGPDPA